jgi:hypothetical protein
MNQLRNRFLSYLSIASFCLASSSFANEYITCGHVVSNDLFSIEKDKKSGKVVFVVYSEEGIQESYDFKKNESKLFDAKKMMRVLGRQKPGKIPAANGLVFKKGNKKVTVSWDKVKNPVSNYFPAKIKGIDLPTPKGKENPFMVNCFRQINAVTIDSFSEDIDQVLLENLKNSIKGDFSITVEDETKFSLSPKISKLIEYAKSKVINFKLLPMNKGKTFAIIVTSKNHVKPFEEAWCQVSINNLKLGGSSENKKFYVDAQDFSGNSQLCETFTNSELTIDKDAEGLSIIGAVTINDNGKEYKVEYKISE